jgi:putative transposase
VTAHVKLKNKWDNTPHRVLEKTMGEMLSNMEKVLEAKNIFERERKSIKTRALGVILYHFGISLRNTSVVISSFEPASHEVVWEWYLRAAKIFQVRKAEHKIIAIDETKIKINGKWRILWAAIASKSC